MFKRSSLTFFWFKSDFPYCASHRSYVRENVRKLEAYVEEMASEDTVSGSFSVRKVQDNVLKLWSVVKTLPEISSDQKNHIKSLSEAVVHSLHNNPDPSPRTPRSRCSSSQFLRPQVTGVTVVTSLSSDKTPLLHLKHTEVGNTWDCQGTFALSAVAAQLLRSFLSTRPRNRTLTLLWIIFMPTSAWISTTSYLSLVSLKTAEKLMVLMTSLNSPTV